MEKKFKARIKWLSKEQGGRQTGLPYGDKYAPIIRITKQKFTSIYYLDEEGKWSLLVNNQEIFSEFETIAEVKYLSEKAPDNLEKDVEFELYEGSNLVAKGVIL